MRSKWVVVGTTFVVGMWSEPAWAQEKTSSTSGASTDATTVAYFVPQRVLTESSWGKASSTRLAALSDQKVAELAKRKKELEAAQQKTAAANMLTDDARLATLKTAEKMRVELERFQQDAEAELQELQQHLNRELEQFLSAVLPGVSREKRILILLRGDTGAIAWADPRLDVTADVVRHLDSVASKQTQGAVPK